MSWVQELRGVLRLRVLQLLALSCLLAGLAALSFIAKTSVRDPDNWWHLKVGDWIVQNQAVPHVGIFSRTAASRPWIAYSWGYEVLLSRIYAWFGLVGFALFGVLLTLAVACVFFWMLRRLSGRFWVAWILCGVGCLAFLFSLMPRPVFLSMALFAVTLTLILEAHRSNRPQLLYGLPLIFVLWANLHIQFIYGLFVLGLFVGVNLLQRLGIRLRVGPRLLVAPALPAGVLLAVFTACALASCIGPYSYDLYGVVFEYSKSQVPYSFIQELQPLDFQYFTDYVLLLLTTAGFFAVGWRKQVDLFKLSLLVIAAVCAFRTSRDAWFVAICAAAFIADLPVEEDQPPSGLKPAELAGVGAVLVVLLFLIAANTGFNARELDRTISREFPVDAVNFLRRNPVPGPLYNHLDWGGFLIWYLPEHPVAIDGRNDLYGDELDALTLKSVRGEYAADPYLKQAGLVLLPKQAPLAFMLTIDPQFRVLYEDQLSVVFARVTTPEKRALMAH
jgi:hypothetical protein